MLKNRVPEILWDYGLVWIRKSGNLSVSSSRYASGWNFLEYITWGTPEISEYWGFNFYDWVSYRANAGLGEIYIGQCVGV